MLASSHSQLNLDEDLNLKCLLPSHMGLSVLVMSVWVCPFLSVDESDSLLPLLILIFGVILVSGIIIIFGVILIVEKR